PRQSARAAGLYLNQADHSIRERGICAGKRIPTQPNQDALQILVLSPIKTCRHQIRRREDTSDVNIRRRKAQPVPPGSRPYFLHILRTISVSLPPAIKPTTAEVNLPPEIVPSTM